MSHYPSKNNLTIEQINKQVDKAGYTSAHVLITRDTGKVEESSITKKNEETTEITNLETIEFKTPYKI